MKTNPNELIYESLAVTPQGDVAQSSNGLTKREHFAAQAMQGILSGDITINNQLNQSPTWVAEYALQCADALIFELNKEPVIEFRQCQKCKGTGRAYSGFGNYETCPMCKGKGGTNHEVET